MIPFPEFDRVTQVRTVVYENGNPIGSVPDRWNFVLRTRGERMWGSADLDGKIFDSTREFWIA